MAKITLPGALGVGAVGAYGYNQTEKYFESSGVSDVLRGFSKAVGSVTGSFDGASSSGRGISGGGGEVGSLRAEVDRLAGLMAEMVRGQKSPNNGGYTVIHTNPRTGMSLIVYPVVGVGLVYLYCRVRGISFTELLFVSRGSMTQFRSTVSEGFTKLWDEMKRQKDDFVSRLAGVRRSQDQLSEAQKAMDEQLRHVGDNVDDVRASTYQISSHVQQLDGRMSEVHDGVLRTNQGIMLLCSTVAEVTNNIGMHNSKTSQALRSFVQQPQLGGGEGPCNSSEASSVLGSSGLRGLIGMDSSCSAGSSVLSTVEVESMRTASDASARVTPLPPLQRSSKSFGMRFFS